MLLPNKHLERILELETALKQVGIRLDALESTFQTELIRLVDLKEQVLNVLNRLEQRQRRAEKKNHDEVAVDPGPSVDSVTQRILARRRSHGVSK